MQHLYECTAQKKATNLSLNSDLLRRSKELNINLSVTLEKALREKLTQKKPIGTLNQFRDEIIASLDFAITGV